MLRLLLIAGLLAVGGCSCDGSGGGSPPPDGGGPDGPAELDGTLDPGEPMDASLPCEGRVRLQGVDMRGAPAFRSVGRGVAARRGEGLLLAVQYVRAEDGAWRTALGAIADLERPRFDVLQAEMERGPVDLGVDDEGRSWALLGTSREVGSARDRLAVARWSPGGGMEVVHEASIPPGFVEGFGYRCAGPGRFVVVDGGCDEEGLRVGLLSWGPEGVGFHEVAGGLGSCPLRPAAGVEECLSGPEGVVALVSRATPRPQRVLLRWDRSGRLLGEVPLGEGGAEGLGMLAPTEGAVMAFELITEPPRSLRAWRVRGGEASLLEEAALSWSRHYTRLGAVALGPERWMLLYGRVAVEARLFDLREGFGRAVWVSGSPTSVWAINPTGVRIRYGRGVLMILGSGEGLMALQVCGGRDG